MDTFQWLVQTFHMVELIIIDILGNDDLIPWEKDVPNKFRKIQRHTQNPAKHLRWSVL